MSNLYTGQPITINLTCTVEEPSSMSAAVSAVITYRKPNNQTGQWTASVNNVTGVVSYSAQPSDIYIHGRWRLQPVVTFAGGIVLPGDTVVMPITKRFE